MSLALEDLARLYLGQPRPERYRHFHMLSRGVTGFALEERLKRGGYRGSALLDDGVEVFPSVLDAKVAALLSGRLESGGQFVVGEGPTRLRGRIGMAEAMALHQALGQVFTGALDCAAMAFFGSHYRIHWLELTRLLPAVPGDRPAPWLRDHPEATPGAHLKLVIALGDAEPAPSEAGLWLYGAKDTARFADAGYAYAEGEARRSSLDSLAAAAGVSALPLQARMLRGGALLYVPFAVLRQERPPVITPADSLTLFLLPNPEPWHREAAPAALAARQGPDEVDNDLPFAWG